MNRRDFLYSCAAVGLLETEWSPRALGVGSPDQNLRAGFDETLVGKPCNLAMFGEMQSWISPEATPLLQKQVYQAAAWPVRLAELPWKDSELDIGVEWAEFRTVNQMVIRFSSLDNSPRRGRQWVEFWDGITTRQGRWRTLEDDTILGIPLEIDGVTWTFNFPQRRTCKMRLRFQDQKQVEIEAFEVYGPSKWKVGETCIEWGYTDQERSYDGSLSMYNGEVLELRPFGGTQARGPFAWTSTAGKGKTAGIVAKLLYTSGMDVDRSIVTLRTKAGDFSFLPGEALEYQPIDIPDFGVYIRNNSLELDRFAYRQKHTKTFRIIDAVVKHPEQTLENARQAIRAKRVTLCFVGVDSNSQKFGVAPDSHLVIGNNDPSYGQQIIPKFALYFASSEASKLFQEPVRAGDFFATEEEKPQSLQEGWLPIVATRWSRNEVSFERVDYATLDQPPEPLDESKLLGNELALMISRLTIRNESTTLKTVSYYIQPWKPSSGQLEYGAMPANAKNAWETLLRADCVLVAEGDSEYAVCAVDSHGRGALSLETVANAVKYSLELNPGEQHSIHTVVPGRPLPVAGGDKLRALPYEQLRDSTVKYWKDRLAGGMQVEIPDQHVQSLFNATLQHFLLAMTKDRKRKEHYPNTAMLYYGSIGSESSPIIQSLDMRGLHARAESCLNAWLSTQGDSMPAGDYASKEGGFYHYWPNYTSCQGGILWALAEHYLYTHDQDWLRKVAPQIVAGCDFIIRERMRTMEKLPGGRRPLWYGLAPAGCVADMRDWEYSFMLNAYFYLGLKKSAQVLQDVDPENARRIEGQARDYLETIRRALEESVALSPVTRLRDGTSVSSVPSYVGLRGLSTDVKDSMDPDLRHGYAYDSTGGPFHLLKGEVVAPDAPEVTWMLNYFEDRFFMFSPLPSRVDLEELSSDWFNLGGFEKLQPYYVHYQDAYLQRDQIPSFLRGFFNTLAAISDPQTLTFQEELDFGGGQPHKTHEEGWFFHQLRHMLVMEMENDLLLAVGTPRQWLEDGKKIGVTRAASYFGELSYRIESFASQGRIEATVRPPTRRPPANLFLRLRHPKQAQLMRVTINDRAWKDFDAAKERIKLPVGGSELKIVAYYS
jgi:hypothetical protein